MHIYKYEALDLSNPGIRLVRLYGGLEEDEIECEIFHAWSYGTESVTYGALSYVWGSSDRSKHTIKANKNPLPVTKNLFSALCHLRRSIDRIMWIDAICIDQDNEKERGHQVGQMSTIYKQAEQVVIWLGCPTLQTDALMNSLQHFEQKSTSNGRTTDQEWERQWSEVKLSPYFFPVNSQKGLEVLLTRSWFERIGVLQEVANAKCAVVCCGQNSVSSHIFAMAPLLIGLEVDPHCRAVLDIMPGPLRKVSWWSGSRELYALMLKFGRSKATDPRDMIFALLGISRDARPNKLSADYTNTVRQTIRIFEKYFFGYNEKRPWTMSDFLEDLPDLQNRFDRLAKFGDAQDTHAFYQLYGDRVIVTEAILKSAFMNKESGKEIIELLHNRQWHSFSHQKVLQAAIRGGRFDIVKMLSGKNGWDSNPTVNAAVARESHPSNITAFEVALGAMKPLLAKHSLQSGPIIDAFSILQNVCRQGPDEILQTMLDHGIDVNQVHEGRHGPLQVAVKAERESNIRLLLDNGALVNGLDGFGELALHCATSRANHGIVNLLLEKRADINLLNSRALSVLQIACRDGTELAMLLLDKGANVNVQDELGISGYESPLEEALLSPDYFWDSNIDLVLKLLANGARYHEEEKNDVLEVQARCLMHNPMMHNPGVPVILERMQRRIRKRNRGGTKAFIRSRPSRSKFRCLRAK